MNRRASIIVKKGWPLNLQASNSWCSQVAVGAEGMVSWVFNWIEQVCASSIRAGMMT